MDAVETNKVLNRLAKQLTQLGTYLVTAESCTGGGIAQACTSIAGSSQWFERGFVTYSNTSKVELVGVQQGTLDQYGAVSEATVKEMLAGALNNSHAQLGLAVSGIAGPNGGSEDKPVGTVWFCWGTAQHRLTRKQLFSGNRLDVQRQAIGYALQVLADWNH